METNYREYFSVVIPGGHFSDKRFDEAKDARDYVAEHIAGMPNNTAMSQESRDYWIKKGMEMKIYFIKERMEITEVPFSVAA